MNNEFSLLIAAICGFLLGLLIWRMQINQWRKSNAMERNQSSSQLQEKTQQIAMLTQKESDLAVENVENKQRISELETLLSEREQQFAEKIGLLQDAKQSLLHGFKEIASSIFDEKSLKLRETNQESLQTILQPLNQRIRDFEKKVTDTYQEEARERFSLTKEIQQLNSMNQRLSEEATNLTKALKGESKQQGIWGELVLERLLEQSGLEKDREYQVQVSLKHPEGQRFQPDVLINLPDNRQIIIDAKVSLTAFERFSSSDDDVVRAENLKSHLLSIRNHIRLLSEKRYQELEGVNSLDFVLLFIPIEPAFQLIIKSDEEIMTDAFMKKIMLVGPNTLLVTLKTIQHIWQIENQSKNADEIARLAGNMYDKFVAFVDDLEEIGSRLGSTQKSYEQACNKLVQGRGNLVKRAEDIKKLGARVNKELPINLTNQLQN